MAFPPHYSRVVKRNGRFPGNLLWHVLVMAETKPHVTGLPSPYSCDLSPTLKRERRAGRELELD